MSLAAYPEKQTQFTSPDASWPLDVACSRKRIFWCLLGAIAIIAALSTASRLLTRELDAESFRGVQEIAFRFDMDRENTLPSWFSSILLFVSAALLFVIAGGRRKQGLRDALQWTILAWGFLYLSLDESASIHEILIVPLRRRLDLGGVFYFSWILPGMILVGIFLAAYARFWWRLPGPIRWRMAVAAALYLGGAVGMELVGGALAEAYGLDALIYTAAMTIEESLEMLGLTVFLVALMQMLAWQRPRLRISWERNLPETVAAQ